MEPKWKYSSEAKKRRYCASCGKRLKKREPVLCIDCLHEALDLDNPEFEELFEEVLM